MKTFIFGLTLVILGSLPLTTWANDRSAYFAKYERLIDEYLAAYEEFSPEYGLFNEDGTFILGILRNETYVPIPIRLVKAINEVGLALYPQNTNLSLVEYEEILKMINARSATHPLAIRDLSFFLEERGEGRFYDQVPIYSISQISSIENSSVLAHVGLALAVTSLIKNPQKALTNSSGTMSLMRAMRSVVLPVTGFVGTGVLATQAYQAKYPGGVNPPPYYYLDFGVPKNQDCLEKVYEDKKLNEVVAEGVGLATGWVAGAACAVRWGGKAAQTANLLATPAKIHPLVLVGSIIVGVVVDRAVAYGTEALLEYGDKKHWQNQVVEAVQEFEAIFPQDFYGRTYDYYAAISKLVRATYELEAYYNFALYKEFLHYQTKLADLYAKYPNEDHRESNPTYQTELSELKNQTTTLMLAIWSDKNASKGDEFISKKVRDELIYKEFSIIEANWSHIEEREQAKIQEYVERFEAYQNQREHQVSFRDFLLDENVYARLRMANELKEGQVAANPEDLMVQVASYLQSKNSRVLDFYAYQLLNRVKRNEILLQKLLKGN